MGKAFPDPVDDRRSTGPRAGDPFSDGWPMPGTLLIAAGGAAFVICLVALAWAQVGVGLAAFALSLLTFGAGLASLTTEGRRLRHVERERLISRRLVRHRN
jgi:hypothetical protein